MIFTTLSSAKRLIILLPLAACGPHVYVKEPYHVEMDRSDLFVDHTHSPDHEVDRGVDDGGHGDWSSDANGGVSDE